MRNVTNYNGIPNYYHYRETILRLVSEGKKHNKLDAQLAELQQVSYKYSV